MNSTNYSATETKILASAFAVVTEFGAASAERIAKVSNLDMTSVVWAIANLRMSGKVEHLAAIDLYAVVE